MGDLYVEVDEEECCCCFLSEEVNFGWIEGIPLEMGECEDGWVSSEARLACSLVCMSAKKERRREELRKCCSFV